MNMKYKLTFKAVRRGAIGKRSQFTRTIIASDLKAATLALYSDFDHVTVEHGYATRLAGGAA